jgi:hypothetical protein
VGLNVEYECSHDWQVVSASRQQLHHWDDGIYVVSETGRYQCVAVCALCEKYKAFEATAA